MAYIKCDSLEKSWFKTKTESSYNSYAQYLACQVYISSFGNLRKI